MGIIDSAIVSDYFHQGDTAANTHLQGRALEDLVCYLFETVPGIAISQRNVLNTFDTEEVDVAFWNDLHPDGFDFLPRILLIECKNWSRPVGNQEVVYFISQLRDRGLDFGILVTSKGVTGSIQNMTNARMHLVLALREKIRVILINRSEIEGLNDSSQLVKLIQTKLCLLAVTGSCL